MASILGVIGGMVAVIVLGAAVTKLDLLAKLYDVRLSTRGIEFIVFSKRVFYTLEFSNINQVIEGRGGYHFLVACNFRNRFFEGCLLIQKKKGFFARKVLITPSNPGIFMDRLIKAGVPVKKAHRRDD